MTMLMIVGIDPLGFAQHVDAAHLRHPDVGDQDVDALALQHLDRRAAVVGHQHLVAVAPAARSTAARASSARRRRRARARGPRRRSTRRALPSREFAGHHRLEHQPLTSHCGAGAPPAAISTVHGACPRPLVDVDPHLAAVVADDAVDDRQPEPGAAREPAAERLEDAVELLRRDADALVRRRRSPRAAARRPGGVDRRASACRRPASRAARWSPGSRRSAGSAPSSAWHHTGSAGTSTAIAVRLAAARRCSAAASRCR